jgi:hypothetical protein
MGELELVARLDNRLLLRDESGTEYRLPICPKLKSAVYSAQTTPQYAALTAQATVITPAKGVAASEKPTTGNVAKLIVVKDELPDGDPQPRLRPAELQIRLRAGDSPEHLAQFSDLTVEQISRFAGPIEAEKADIIKAMRRTRLNTTSAAISASASSGSSTTVGELVTQHLGARGITSEQVTWYARRDIGAPWLIELKFEDGGRTHSARWTFDAARNQLTALDDEARWLSSPDTPVTDTIPITLHQNKRPSTVRGSRANPVEFDLSDGPQVSGAPIPMTPRHLGQVKAEAAAQESEASVAGIVPLSHWKSEKLETVAVPVATPPAALVETAPVAEVESRSEPAVSKSDETKPSEQMADALKSPRPASKNANHMLFGEAATAPAGVNANPPALTGSTPVVTSKKGRSKIPSWDQIVFGGKD